MRKRPIIIIIIILIIILIITITIFFLLQLLIHNRAGLRPFPHTLPQRWRHIPWKRLPFNLPSQHNYFPSIIKIYK